MLSTDSMHSCLYDMSPKSVAPFDLAAKFSAGFGNESSLCKAGATGTTDW